jgi:hypothetical protein
MSRNRDALEAAVAARNAGDLECYLTLYDESIRLHGYNPGQTLTKSLSAPTNAAIATRCCDSANRRQRLVVVCNFILRQRNGAREKSRFNDSHPLAVPVYLARATVRGGTSWIPPLQPRRKETKQ